MALQEKIYAAQTVSGVPPESYPLSFRSIAHLLAEREQSSASATFLVYYDEANHRTEYSYQAFIAEVRRTAAFMRSLGLRRGDRIATAAHNHPDTIVQYFAAWLADLCIVPLNMSEDDERLRYILSNSQVKILFCREDYLERVREVLPESIDVVGVFNDTATKDGLHERCKTLPPYIPDEISPQLDDECFIVYTSGTTGNPKGVVLVQRNIIADSEAIARWHRLGADSRVMCVLPVHHVNGTIVTHTTPMIAGATTVLNRKFQTEYFFERIQRENVQIVSVVPTLLAFLLEYAKSEAAKGLQISVPDSFRYAICGAGPLTCSLAEQFEKIFQRRILHGYGLSETTCYSCYLPIDIDASEHLRWMQDFGFPSIGVPLPVNDMEIHDENGNALQEMERGEIVIRGANVMKEYYQNPEANEKTFAHGWFRSGDEGFFKCDTAGRPYFFITGRLKELIIRGGVNLAPLEIDEVLSRAPGVKAAICVGFENDFYGEEVGALVIAESPENTTEASKEAILEYCRTEMPFSKSPKVVVFTDSLPVTTTGKYQRNRVKHLFAAWKAVQFRKG